MLPRLTFCPILIGRSHRASDSFSSPSGGGTYVLSLAYFMGSYYAIIYPINYFWFMARRRSVKTINIPSSGSGAAVPLSLVSSSGYAWGDGSSDSFYLDSSGTTGPLDTVKVYSPENFSALLRERSVDIYDTTDGVDSLVRSRVRIRQRANSLTAINTSYVFSAKKGVSATLTFTTTATVYTEDQDPVNWLQYGTSNDSLYSVSEPVVSGMTISITVTTLSSWDNTSVAGNFAEIWVQQGQLRASTTVSQGAVTFSNWGWIRYEAYSLTSSNDDQFAPLLNQEPMASSSHASRKLRYAYNRQYNYTCRFHRPYVEKVYTDGSIEKAYIGSDVTLPEGITVSVAASHPFSDYPMVFEGSGLGLTTEANDVGGVDYVLTCASPIISDETVPAVPEASLGAYFSLRATYTAATSYYTLDAGHITRDANTYAEQSSLYYLDLDAGGSSSPVQSSILLETYDAVVRYQFILHEVLTYVSGYTNTVDTAISVDDFDVSMGSSLSASNHYKAVKDTAVNGMVVTGGSTCLYPGTLSYTRHVISSGGSSYVEYDNAITVTFSNNVNLSNRTYHFSVYRTGRGFTESGSLYFVVPTSEWQSVYASYAKATLVLSYDGHTRTVESSSVLVPSSGGVQITIAIPTTSLLEAVSGDYTMTIEGGFDSWASLANSWVPQFWESSVAVQVYYRLTAVGTSTYFRPSDGFYPTDLVYGRYGSSTDYLYVTKNS